MEIFDVIIIGGGPAGLFSAALCAEAGLKTCLYETNKSAGKKLLITGQGRCNITNTEAISEFINRYGSKTRFVRKCLYAFSNTDLTDLFNSRGLKLIARSDGKVFPESEKAADVLKHLLEMCRKSGVNIIYGSRITSVGVKDGFFTVQNESAASGCLILATGGFTFPSTGSLGDGYTIAESLGHRTVTPKPSLTGIIADAGDYKLFSCCAGTAIDCEVSLFRNNSKTGAYGGRLLFTHRGLSGPVIIDNSRDFFPGDEIRLNLLPELRYEDAAAGFIRYCAEHGKNRIKNFFTSFGIPDRIVGSVFARSGASAASSEQAAAVSAGDRKKLLSAFCALSFRIEATEGKNRAMCTAGGIDTAEINPATMESRLMPGLFFAGEIIDVDGDSGGYNLQFAFSSAHAAASAVQRRKK